MVIENYFREKNYNLNGFGRHPSSSQRPSRMSIKKMARKREKKGKYQSDKKGDKKVTKNGDEYSELQNSSLEKSPKKVKEKVNHRKSHQKSLKKTWAPICSWPLVPRQPIARGIWRGFAEEQTFCYISHYIMYIVSPSYKIKPECP